MINFGFKKFSRIIIKSDSSSWVLDELKKEIEASIKKKINFLNHNLLKIIKHQCIFFVNKYDILNKIHETNNIAISYFHTDPSKLKENNRILKKLKNNKVKCVQVTNNYTKSFLIKKGVDKKKIFKIPIGIEIKKFPFISPKKKIILKKKKNLDNYLVIGSFQKDGIGWKNGDKPKKIKGPDIFVKIINNLKNKHKIHVILTGPSRGYVIKKLKEMHVSYEHHFLKKYEDIKKFYKFLDIYLVTSREEGGPRSVLESMASGVVIYSTRVGQAKEIIKNSHNGFLYDISKTKEISRKIIKNYLDHKKTKKILFNARITANIFSYNKMKKDWLFFFKNLKQKK